MNRGAAIATIAVLACAGPAATGPQATFQPVSGEHLGYVRTETGEHAVVWRHCLFDAGGVKGAEVTIGRAPVPGATVVVHDPAEPGAPPVGIATTTTARARVELTSAATGARALTVLEGEIAPAALERLLRALRDPDRCDAGDPDDQGIIRPPQSPCKPCWPNPDVECAPCPPPCPDSPCPEP
jgi:hypothetical protein